MPKFELISTKRNMTLGTIECDNVTVAELFLAMNFPNDFFGANIKGVDCNSMLFIPVEAAFADEDDTNPVNIALKNMDSKIKIQNGLCEEKEDRDGILRCPYKRLKSENGQIVEDVVRESSKANLMTELDSMLKNFGYWSDSSLYISVTKCIQNAMLGWECVPKANVKSDLERILRNFGFYSKASIWISMMNFVDRMYA